jgi:iron complex outermembrane receptor protein
MTIIWSASSTVSASDGKTIDLTKSNNARGDQTMSRFLTAATLAMIVCHIPAPCNAQELAAEAGLQEIIVTAEKRPERLQEVPAQIDVLTGDTLEAMQMRETPDITATVPNLTVARNDTYSNSTIVLRSITQANNSDVPVAVIVDGVPQDDSKQFNTYLFDIAQIEVLKGPQGSLYGRNAEAGAIIITTAPPTNEFKGFADVSYGNGETVDGRAGISGALIPDRILFRVAGNYARSDGLIRNSFQDRDSDYIDFDRSLRGDVLFIASDTVKLDLIAEYRGFRAGTTFFAPVFSGKPNDFVDPQGNFPNVDNGYSAFLDAKLEADLSFATFTSVSGYARIKEHQISDVDFTNPVQSPTVFQVGDNQPSGNRIISQDLRLVSPSAEAFRWLVSADFLEASQLLSTNIFADTGHYATDPYNPALLLESSSADNKRKDYGISTQVDYDILKHLTLTAGVRYDDDQRRQINLNANTQREATFNAVQPKFTATYKFNSDALLYVTYGEGFRSGGFNQPNFSVPVFSEETLKNYEVGFKSQWLERKLTLNGAAYTGNVANYQYSYIDFATASPVTGNIERVRISGGELESRYSPIGGLSVFLNIGVSVPKISSYSVFPQYVGNQTPRANDYTVQTGVDYSRPVTATWSFFAGADVQYLSKVYWYIDNLDVQNSKTYTNARFGLKNKRWTATIWGRNIFDTRAYETYDPNQATGLGRDVGYPNKPAQYGVEAMYKF